MRVEAFKKQEWNEYKALIETAAKNFFLLSQEETKFGLDYIDLTQQNYNVTLQKVLAVPDIKKTCEEEDLKMRSRLDARTLTDSREKIKEMFKILIEGEYKLSKIPGANTPQGQSNLMIEKSKVYDNIYVTYGVKIHHLQSAVASHGIDKDEDIADFKNSLKAVDLEEQK